MKKLIWQFRNWIMNRKNFTETFCKGSLFIILMMFALLLIFLIVLTG